MICYLEDTRAAIAYIGEANKYISVSMLKCNFLLKNNNNKKKTVHTIENFNDYIFFKLKNRRVQI